MPEIEGVRARAAALVRPAPNSATQNRTRGCTHLSQIGVPIRIQSDVTLSDSVMNLLSWTFQLHLLGLVGC